MADNELNEYEIQSGKIRERMDRIGRKIMILSGKGGVGKTTLTVNLARALSDMGCKVGILDIDLHGPNIAKMLGVEDGVLTSPDGVLMNPIKVNDNLFVMSLSFALDEPNSPVIWRGALKMSAIRQFLGDVIWGDLDYLLIDTPPGTGDEQLTAVQAIPEMTGAVVVTTPQEVALLDSRRSIGFARRCDIAVLGVVENMSSLKCPHCGELINIFPRGGGKRLSEEMHVSFLGEVPMEVGLAEAEDKGKDILNMDSMKMASSAIREIADKINLMTKCSTTRDTSKLSKEGCLPSSCSSCSLDCPSRKK